MSWESRVFPLQYLDFPHLKSNFPRTKSDSPKSAFYFLQRLSAFFNGFLTFFNGFPLAPMAFWFSPTAFRFSSTAFHFPRNPRKSIYGEKYTKDCYSSFVFFATRSPSFVIPAKQYLHLTQQKARSLVTKMLTRNVVRSWFIGRWSLWSFGGVELLKHFINKSFFMR